MFTEFPYTNFNQVNLDWVLQTVKAVQAWVEGEATEDIQNFINAQFDKIMIDAAYDEATETITLKRKLTTEE